MNDLLRVTPDEAASAKVDAALAGAHGFGMGPAVGPTAPPRLWQRPYLALSVAGFIGALLAWAAIEPRFEDGLRLGGPVVAVSEPSEWTGVPDLEKVIQLGDVTVFIVASTPVVDLTGGGRRARDIQAGEPVEVVLAEIEEGEVTGGVATLVRLGSSYRTPASLRELQSRRVFFALLLFPITAMMVGLFIGATDGVLSKAWGRAARSALVGGVVGFGATLAALIPTGLLFGTIQRIAIAVDTSRTLEPSSGALLVIVIGRGLAWALVGSAAGMGLGLFMRSRALFWNGVIGGATGALIGGVLFDPLGIALTRLAPTGGAEVSRALGLSLVGAGAGLMIGVVELIVRDAWLKVLTGPIAGKEFVLYRDPTWIGSSPKCEIYLFKDPRVAPRHAAIHRVAEYFEIEDQATDSGTGVAGRPVKRQRLQDRDRIQIGETLLEFRVRED